MRARLSRAFRKYFLEFLMNKNFKVVFSKARNALMVVNEATASVQHKGAKTVIAAAVASIVAGSALAAGTDTWVGAQISGNASGVTASTNDVFGTNTISTPVLNTEKDTVTVTVNADKVAAKSQTDNDARGAFTNKLTPTLNLVLSDSSFTNNSSEKTGGAATIWMDGNGSKLTHTVQDSVFSGNTAKTKGGALALLQMEGTDVAGSTFVIAASEFSNNSITDSGRGGAVYADDDLTIKDSTFDSNKSAGHGGAVYLAGEVPTTDTNLTLTLDNATFQNNQAGTPESSTAAAVTGNGGAIAFNGDAVIKGTASFINNSATANGGAIGTVSDNQDASISLEDSLFQGNHAATGGAVYLQGQTATFTDTTFTGNTSDGWGGAVRMNGGDVTFAVTEGKNIAYTGNASTDAEDAANVRYEGHTGGFLYLQAGADATFNIGKDATLTIGTVGADTDSIVSLNQNDGTVITKTGEGNLVVNSDMSGFVGTLTVYQGKMTVASSIGNYDINAQIAANNAKDGGEATFTDGTQTKLEARGEDAVLEIGDLVINSTTADSKAGTQLNAVDGGKVIAGDVLVTTGTYKDLNIGTGETAGKDLTTTGYGIVNVYSTKSGDPTLGTAEFNSLTLNGKNVKFDKYGSGELTILQGLSVEGEGAAFTVADGKATVEGDVVSKTVDGVKVGANKALVVNGGISGEKGGMDVAGTLETALTNVVEFDAVANKASEKNEVIDFATTGSELIARSAEDLTYTVAGWQSIHTTSGAEFLKLADATLVAADADKPLTIADAVSVQGYTGRSVMTATADKTTGDASFATTTDTHYDITVGQIVVDQSSEANAAKVDSVTIGNETNHTVIRGTAAGTDQVVVINNEATDGAALSFVNTSFGEKAGDAGMLDHAASFNGVTVTEDTTYHFNDVTVTGSGLTVSGTMFAKNFVEPAAGTNEGKVTVDGGVLALHGFVPGEEGVTQTVRTFGLAADTTLSNGALFAADDDLAVAQKLHALYESYEAADVEAGFKAEPEAVNMAYLSEKVHFTNGLKFDTTTDSYNVVAIDLAGVAASGFDKTKDAIVTIDGNKTIDNVDVDFFNLNANVVSTGTAGDYINVGTALANADVDFGSVLYEDATVDSNGHAAISVSESRLAGLKAFDFNTYGSVEEQLRTYTSGNAIASTIIANVGDWYDGFMAGVYNGLKDQLNDQVTIDDFVDALSGTGTKSLKDLLKTGVSEVEVLSYIASEGEAFVKNVSEIEHAQSNMAVYGGAFSTSFDINDQIRNTIDRRSSLANLNVASNATGITPWVDVMGTWNTADGLYGSSGYEADIYGATLGADYTASCGAILGAAISIGQADANSVDASTKVDNDVDFWGVSFYGSHRIGNVNGKFDIGYVSTSNDLSANAGYFGHVKESLDADIFTVGVGAEYLATVGSLNVVPHAGIRWSSLDMDDSKYGADYDKMNLFQMPIGVAFSGTFDMTGWKVAPMLDISVVPTFGDKDAVASYTGGIKDTVRVVDSNPVQMTLGVNAQVDAWTLGVNYGLSAGSDERLNNAFNFNARYTF